MKNSRDLILGEVVYISITILSFDHGLVKIKNNYHGILIFQNSKGNKNWFEKSDSSRNLG